MLGIDYRVVEIPFHKEFVTNKGNKNFQKFLQVRLQYGALSGYGECPVISYSIFDDEDWVKKIEAKKKFIEQYAYNGTDRFWHFLHHLFPDDHYLISAFDIASWDLFAKMRGKKVFQLMNLSENKSTMTDRTLSIGDVKSMKDEIIENPWPIYKLKWKSNELTKLFSVSDSAAAHYRVDLNEAWDMVTLQKFLLSDEASKFEFVEQPTPVSLELDLTALKNPKQIPIMADEAFQSIEDLEFCSLHYDGINLKLPKCGGLTPALEIIRQARAKNMKLLLGTMSEGMIGTAAQIQISSLFDYLDLDGCLLLRDETATGVIYENHVPLTTGTVGLGIDVNWT